MVWEVLDFNFFFFLFFLKMIRLLSDIITIVLRWCAPKKKHFTHKQFNVFNIIETNFAMQYIGASNTYCTLQILYTIYMYIYLLYCEPAVMTWITFKFTDMAWPLKTVLPNPNGPNSYRQVPICLYHMWYGRF